MKRTEWDSDEIIAGGVYRFKWSLITSQDKITIQKTVESMCDSLSIDTLNFLEIGTYNGATAWGVKEITESKGKKLNYWGVDVMTHDAVLFHPGSVMVIGDSTEVFYLVPDLPFDILFIDGPHNSGNCMLDFLNFAPKVKVGGLILFHDASPASQFPIDCKLPPEKVAEWNERGWEIPVYHEFGTAVLVALEKLGLRDPIDGRRDYGLVGDYWSSEPYGGISIYRKVA